MRRRSYVTAEALYTGTGIYVIQKKNMVQTLCYTEDSWLKRRQPGELPRLPRGP